MYHQDDWAPVSAGGSSPGASGGASCTLTFNEFYDVGIQMRINFPEPIELQHAQEENDRKGNSPRYIDQNRRLSTKADDASKSDDGHEEKKEHSVEDTSKQHSVEGTSKQRRELGTKTPSFDEPYKFLSTHESCENFIGCYCLEEFWHRPETHMRELLSAKNQLSTHLMNRVYERYLG